ADGIADAPLPPRGVAGGGSSYWPVGLVFRISSCAVGLPEFGDGDGLSCLARGFGGAGGGWCAHHWKWRGSYPGAHSDYWTRISHPCGHTAVAGSGWDDRARDGERRPAC